jgi:hypothetical protein
MCQTLLLTIGGGVWLTYVVAFALLPPSRQGCVVAQLVQHLIQRSVSGFNAIRVVRGVGAWRAPPRSARFE